VSRPRDEVVGSNVPEVGNAADLLGDVSLISVVIVLHNSADTVAATVASLPAAAELIVVDNASVDDGAAIALAGRPDARLVSRSDNRGFGAGCNAGAALVTRRYVMFLNPDAVLLEGAAEAMLEILALEPNLIVGPAHVTLDGTVLTNCRRRSNVLQDVFELLPAAKRWTPDALRRDVPGDRALYVRGGPVAYVQGACFAVSCDTFRRVGGFDEDFFLYGEEETLADKVRAIGGRSIFIPDSRVLHEGGASTNKVASQALRHLYRSRILFYAKRDGVFPAIGAVVAIGVAATARAGAMAIRRRGGAKPTVEAFRWLWAVERGLGAGLRAARRVKRNDDPQGQR